jgi:hypothetical protein
MNNQEPENKSVWSKPFYGPIEYEMPKAMAKMLLAERKGADRNLHPQVYLRKVVNEDFGVKGNCVKVTLVD